MTGLDALRARYDLRHRAGQRARSKSDADRNGRAASACGSHHWFRTLLLGNWAVGCDPPDPHVGNLKLLIIVSQFFASPFVLKYWLVYQKTQSSAGSSLRLL